MQSFAHRLFAIIIIAGVIISAIPFNALHQHTVVQCDDHITEIDLCHLQIYHGYFSVENNCEHTTHLHSVINKCDWCKFVKPVRDDYNTVEYTQIFQFDLNIDLTDNYRFSYLSAFVLSSQCRAPPIS